MSRRSIKMKPNLPFRLESKLVNRYGYYIQKRFPGEYILFVKMGNAKPDMKAAVASPISTQPNPAINAEVPSLGRQLTVGEEFILEQRCDNVANFYADPYAFARQIIIRLNNMRQALGSVEEQQFVLDYMNYNFPEDEEKKIA